jgi:hypothetical protein
MAPSTRTKQIHQIDQTVGNHDDLKLLDYSDLPLLLDRLHALQIILSDFIDNTLCKLYLITRSIYVIDAIYLYEIYFLFLYVAFNLYIIYYIYFQFCQGNYGLPTHAFFEIFHDTCDD